MEGLVGTDKTPKQGNVMCTLHILSLTLLYKRIYPHILTHLHMLGTSRHLPSILHFSFLLSPHVCFLSSGDRAEQVYRGSGGGEEGCGRRSA